MVSGTGMRVEVGMGVGVEFMRVVGILVRGKPVERRKWEMSMTGRPRRVVTESMYDAPEVSK